MVPSRTLSDDQIHPRRNQRCLVVDWKHQVWERHKVPNKLGRTADVSGSGSDVSDGVMRVRLKSGLASGVVSHLLSDSGLHSRIPAASFPFSFLPAAPPHGPDAQECVGGVKRLPIDGRSG